MNVYFSDDWTRVSSCSDNWNSLLDGSAPESMFLAFEWYDALRAAHAAHDPIRTCTVEEDGEVVACWPLRFSRRRRMGVLPWKTAADGGEWFVPHNGIATRGSDPGLVEQMLGFVLSNGDWDSLHVMGLIEQGSWHNAFIEACDRLRLTVDSEPGVRSPYLPLEGTWEEYLGSCHKKFRSDLKRCRRSMEQLGDLELCRHTDANEVASAYEQVLEIERESWKHGAGTAITSRPWEATFYERLLARCAPQGRIQISLALVDGRPVAHDVGLLHENRYACLKTSFVEEIRKSNPGKVLRQFILEGLYERGIKEHDFLGEDEPWKVQWTSLLRPHVNLTVYRHRWHAAMIDRARKLKGLVVRRDPG